MRNTASYKTSVEEVHMTGARMASSSLRKGKSGTPLNLVLDPW